ncbi:hypothetical protein AmDm5_0019 [Acetobacter malorum]|nr:hypothetical protein AmDm5_0019 [Acetobacter malorum]
MPSNTPERTKKRQKRDRKGKKAAIFMARTIPSITATPYDASHDSSFEVS